MVTHSSIVSIFFPLLLPLLFTKVLTNSTTRSLPSTDLQPVREPMLAQNKMAPMDINFISKLLSSQLDDRQPPVTFAAQTQCYTCALDSPPSSREPSFVPLRCEPSLTCGIQLEKESKRRPGFGFFSKLPEVIDKGKRFLNFGITITNNFAINLKINMTQQDVSYMMGLLQGGGGGGLATAQRCK